MVGGGLRWFEMILDGESGLGWLEVVWDGMRWLEIVCGGLSYFLMVRGGLWGV